MERVIRNSGVKFPVHYVVTWPRIRQYLNKQQCSCKGLEKKLNPKLTLEVGRLEWVGGSRSHKKKKLIGKSYQNSPILVMIYCVCVLLVHTLLEGVSHYDLSVLTMSEMVF